MVEEEEEEEATSYVAVTYSKAISRQGERPTALKHDRTIVCVGCGSTALTLE